MQFVISFSSLDELGNCVSHWLMDTGMNCVSHWLMDTGMVEQTNRLMDNCRCAKGVHVV